MHCATTAKNGADCLLELEGHPYFLASQFHPEFKSTPWSGHPLFNAFIKAAVEHQKPAAKA